MNAHVDDHTNKNNIQYVMMVAWQREKQAQLSNHCYIISRTDTFKVPPPAIQTFNMHPLFDWCTIEYYDISQAPCTVIIDDLCCRLYSRVKAA